MYIFVFFLNVKKLLFVSRVRLNDSQVHWLRRNTRRKIKLIRNIAKYTYINAVKK